MTHYTIKPLAWDKFSEHEWIAKCVFGEYMLIKYWDCTDRRANKRWLFQLNWHGHPFNEFVSGMAFEEAKAAAEADWQERVKACLVPVPGHPFDNQEQW